MNFKLEMRRLVRKGPARASAPAQREGRALRGGLLPSLSCRLSLSQSEASWRRTCEEVGNGLSAAFTLTRLLIRKYVMHALNNFLEKIATLVPRQGPHVGL